MKTITSAHPGKYPKGIVQQALLDTKKSKVYAIIQGALWCKGYGTGATSITENFYGGTGNAIKELKKDAGLKDPNSTVDLDTMKALLSMNQYQKVWDGAEDIREIQQALNRGYRDYLGLIPCDGIYGRDLCKAFIKVLQAIEGLSPAEATGSFGPYTMANIPYLPEHGDARAVQLFKYALRCNNYLVMDLHSTSLGISYLTETIKSFQRDYGLPETGKGDTTTWMSLLTSCGNSYRTAKACDCSTILDADKAASLYDAGYRYVGRYLTGTVGGTLSKALTTAEIGAIFSAGLRIFAIYQDNSPKAEYFNYERGRIDAGLAFDAAKRLGIPYGEVIYFAVDYDMIDSEVTRHAIPYFEGIRDIAKNYLNRYIVGIYASRNVCSVVSFWKLAASSFVADMSTGFSGNMGYPIPDNWAFDQFHEYTFQSSNGQFDLDKDGYSGRYDGFNKYVRHMDDEVELPEEDIQLGRAKYLTECLNINADGKLTLEDKVSVTIVPGVVDVSVGVYTSYATHNDDKQDSDISKRVTINIKNGQIPTAQLNEVKELYNGFKQDLQMSIDSADGLRVLSKLSKEIDNGTVTFGIGFTSTKKLLIYICVTEELWSDENGKHTVYLDILYKIGSDENFNSTTTYQQLSNVASAILVLLALLILAILLREPLLGGVVIGWVTAAVGVA